ncbi:signal recognition particle subunit SRP72 [Nakaseomyces bracarensis]|uniref:signal recognition particle subunit SRP72 n=1 Tax=Nakaseomyces bracarensis TaxID=273131 RepID=UPI0038711318
MVQKNLTDLLSQLDVQSSNDEHSRAEATCKQLLGGGCSNQGEVFRHWLVALIKQDKYQKALQLLSNYKKIDEKHGNEFALEKLYIYYKLNIVDKFEALYKNIAGNKTNLDRGLLHIRAQFCFKNGDDKEALEVYKMLSENNGGHDNETELRCNTVAPLTSSPTLTTPSEIKADVMSLLSSEESYDLLFNYSIILVSVEELELASKVLNKAYELAITEGYQNDIDTIELQRAYLLQISGQSKESKQILKPLLERLVPGSPLHLVAKSNNLSFVDYSKFNTNFSFLLRELNQEKFYTYNLQQYSHKQWSVIQNNILFLHLFNNNEIHEKKSLLSKTLHNYEKLVDNVVLEPYKTQAKKLYHFALKSIQSGNQGNTIGNLLVAVQFLAVEKEYENAIRLCEQFINHDGYKKGEPSQFDERHMVVCSILFQLYRLSSRNTNINKLAETLNKLPTTSISEYARFWIHIGYEYLANGELEKAKETLNKVLQNANNLSSEDSEIIQAVLSTGENIFDEASRLVEDIDVDELLSKGIKPIAPKSADKAPAALLRAQKKKIDIRKKKKRTMRAKKFLSKRENVKKNPDPERWLPMKDRSSYRPKKRQLGKNTQGGATTKKIEQSLDITKKTAAKTANAKSKSKPKSKKKGRK